MWCSHWANWCKYRCPCSFSLSTTIHQEIRERRWKNSEWCLRAKWTVWDPRIGDAVTAGCPPNDKGGLTLRVSTEDSPGRPIPLRGHTSACSASGKSSITCEGAGGELGRYEESGPTLSFSPGLRLSALPRNMGAALKARAGGTPEQQRPRLGSPWSQRPDIPPWDQELPK